MAITNVYGESEFQMAIKAETTIGTALLTTMQLMNVDSITPPDPGAVDIRDIKSGVGRTMKAADVIVEDKAVSKTFTVAGIADKTVLPMLVENLMTNIVGSSPLSFDIPYNYTQPELTHGTTTISDNTRTLTLAWVSAESGKAIIYNGCVVTDLTISADANTDGGLVRYSATIVTGYIPCEPVLISSRLRHLSVAGSYSSVCLKMPGLSPPTTMSLPISAAAPLPPLAVGMSRRRFHLSVPGS